MPPTRRFNPRLFFLLRLLAVMLIPVGSGAETLLPLPLAPAAWLAIGVITVATLIATPRSCPRKPPRTVRLIGPDTPDSEVMDLINEHIFDLERWENEGGLLRPRD